MKNSKRGLAMTGKKKPPVRVSASSSKTIATGYVFEDAFLGYELGPGHPESPQRLAAIKAKLAGTGLDKRLVPLIPLTDPLPWIGAIHTKSHISSIQKLDPIGAIAELAVGGALSAVKAVCEGTVRNAFCALRPPGHHARNTGQEEGFCFYNNVAIAARFAQNEFKCKKILIVDWDFHHGNGTEESFYEDPTVLYFSTHYPLAYPGTGYPDKEGKGDGQGYNVNVSLPCGATDEDIIDIFQTALVPRANQFRPDFVLVSAGFDGRTNDKLGCFDITDAGFGRLTQIVMAIAHSHCNDRLVAVLEGGYTSADLADAVFTHVKTLLEYRPG
jgi:acetoin utilization deacetylase AcuC-like enzyme